MLHLGRRTRHEANDTDQDQRWRGPSDIEREDLLRGDDGVQHGQECFVRGDPPHIGGAHTGGECGAEGIHANRKIEVVHTGGKIAYGLYERIGFGVPKIRVGIVSGL